MTFSFQVSEGSSLLLDADDILLFKFLSSPSDLAVFKHDVDLISAWISSNYLTSDVEKSKCMLISRSCSHRLNFVIFLNGKQLLFIIIFLSILFVELTSSRPCS